MDEIYLLRQDTGSRDDFWPVSAHRTLEGASKALTERAKEYELTVFPGGSAQAGPGDPDPYPHAGDPERNDSELFIAKLPVGD